MKKSIELLFGRLRKRAELTNRQVNPSLLRDSFAMRYLQAGGNPFLLLELLGLREMAAVKRYLQRNEQMRKDQPRAERPSDPLSIRTDARPS